MEYFRSQKHSYPNYSSRKRADDTTYLSFHNWAALVETLRNGEPPPQSPTADTSQVCPRLIFFAIPRIAGGQTVTMRIAEWLNRCRRQRRRLDAATVRIVLPTPCQVPSEEGRATPSVQSVTRRSVPLSA